MYYHIIYIVTVHIYLCLGGRSHIRAVRIFANPCFFIISLSMFCVSSLLSLFCFYVYICFTVKSGVIRRSICNIFFLNKEDGLSGNSHYVFHSDVYRSFCCPNVFTPQLHGIRFSYCYGVNAQ